MYHYRTIFAVICIFFNTLLYAQQEEDLRVIEVRTDIYEISYSQTYQQPLTIKYTVICDAMAPSYSRHGMRFEKVDGIKDKWYKINKLGNGFFVLKSKVLSIIRFNSKYI